MPAIIVFLIFVPDITTFTMLIFHFRLGGEVFSMNFPLPVWWKIIISSSAGLLYPQNIDLAVEIAFLSCL